MQSPHHLDRRSRVQQSMLSNLVRHLGGCQIMFLEVGSRDRIRTMILTTNKTAQFEYENWSQERNLQREILVAFTPGRLESSHCQEEGRAIPTNKIEAVKLICDLRNGRGHNGHIKRHLNPSISRVDNNIEGGYSRERYWARAQPLWTPIGSLQDIVPQLLQERYRS